MRVDTTETNVSRHLIETVCQRGPNSGQENLVKNAVFGHPSVNESSNYYDVVSSFSEAHDDNEPFDVVFLDIIDQNFDSDKAIVKIRDLENSYGISENKVVCITILTSNTSPAQIIKSYYKSGCNEYIIKPITKKILREKLLEICNS